MLAYLAVVTTVLTVAVTAAVIARRRWSRPTVAVSGYHEDDHPAWFTDADDSGVRIIDVEVASAYPLELVSSVYRVVLPDKQLSLAAASHHEVVDALRAADGVPCRRERGSGPTSSYACACRAPP